MIDRPFPPFTQLGMASLALIVADGIYLSSHLPANVSLGPAIALLAASAVVMLTNLFLLGRVRDFPWTRFWWVARWALLAYLITSGLIEYAFVRDHMSGGTLVVLTLSLAVYAIHVPTLIGATVARYDVPD